MKTRRAKLDDVNAVLRAPTGSAGILAGVFGWPALGNPPARMPALPVGGHQFVGNLLFIAAFHQRCFFK